MAKVKVRQEAGDGPGAARPPSDAATQALYTISVVSRLVDFAPRAIRSCERAGLVKPTRSLGGQGLYSRQDLERLHRIKALMSDMGVNLAGVEVALRLMDRVAELERKLEDVRSDTRTPPTHQKGGVR